MAATARRVHASPVPQPPKPPKAAKAPKPPSKPKPLRATIAVAAEKYVAPRRQWDKATDLVTMFAFTGFVAGETPQSVLLISEPGSGKTELLERFSHNSWLAYASDITTRGLYPLLRLSGKGMCTHVVATEFQKFFLRKSSTAEATLGTLCQAMEEGVGRVLVGSEAIDFGGAQLGLIGAITHDTVHKWRAQLREYGFWSRVAAFEWTIGPEEMRLVMDRIADGDKTDLQKVILSPPDRKIPVDFPRPLSRQFMNYVLENFQEYTPLRVFNRFRVLAMSCALLEGRDVVKARDVEKVVAFDSYWALMETGNPRMHARRR